MKLVQSPSSAYDDLDALVERFFSERFSTDNPLITQAVKRLLAAGGKRLRPRITLLSAAACGGNPVEHLHLAAYMELIHVATLIHDDVVDNAQTRRGVNATAVDYGNRVSVLAGDYLFASAALKLFDLEYYAGLAVTLKRGEEVDLEMLTAHLGSVGYAQMDLVEMPGQFTRRGGILDVYSPEADRPVRIEFFGDEIETIRKFDPETQRSQSGLDEAQLLPLTETPVTERLLAAVNGRLSKDRVEIEDEEMAAEVAAAGGVSVFPGWEFFAAVAGAEQSLLKLCAMQRVDCG